MLALFAQVTTYVRAKLWKYVDIMATVIVIYCTNNVYQV